MDNENSALSKIACFAIGFVTVFLWASVVSAQTTVFTDQGRLTDGGTPANGTYSMQFKIFDTGTVGSGAQFGPTLMPPPVQVTNGTFTVQLDFGAGVFTGPPRFLETTVNGTILNPRPPITSTPYAIRSLTAVNADTATSATQLGGVDAARFVQSDAAGNVNLAGDLTEVKLQISLRENDYPKYEVAVEPVRGSTIFHRAGLLRNAKKRGATIVFSVPAGRFASGDYTLALKGVSQSGEVEDVSKMFFRVVK